MRFFKFRKKNESEEQKRDNGSGNSAPETTFSEIDTHTKSENADLYLEPIQIERAILPTELEAEELTPSEKEVKEEAEERIKEIIREKKYTFPSTDLLDTQKSTDVKVPLSELVKTTEYAQADVAKIPVVIGKTVVGETIIANLVDMPHLLIVGVSASGKSVCLDSIILSILLRQPPEMVQLALVNASGVGLMSYNGIPNLLLNPVTSHSKVSGLFTWIDAEARRRYELIQASGVRDFEGYNALVERLDYLEDEKRPSPLPRIVVAIDELGDILLQSDKDFEEIYQKAIQRGRGAGIHFVATTNPVSGALGQRLYASFSSKVACALASSEDSKLAINMRGAERLLGRGDMLFMPMDQYTPTHLQGAYVSDDEINRVVQFIRENSEGYSYLESVYENTNPFVYATSDEDGLDLYFEDAGRLIIERDKASIGMLQRILKIGFNRASRIMDQLCEAGVVSEEEGTKPRNILMDRMQFEEMLAKKRQ